MSGHRKTQRIGGLEVDTKIERNRAAHLAYTASGSTHRAGGGDEPLRLRFHVCAPISLTCTHGNCAYRDRIRIAASELGVARRVAVVHDHRDL